MAGPGLHTQRMGPLHLLALLLSLLARRDAACEVNLRGFYDPRGLRYRNVQWDAVTAPTRGVEIEARLFKLTPEAPVEASLSATAGGDTAWHANATFTLYAASSCGATAVVETRHAATEEGSPHLSLSFTSHAHAACASRYYLAAELRWTGPHPEALSLAVDGETCFARNVCCVSSGTCAASPHSTCTDRRRCVESGNSVNESVTCSAGGEVCCVLSSRVPDPPSPGGGDDHSPPHTAALSAYILFCFIGLGAIGAGYYYIEKRRMARVVEVEML